MFETCLQKQTNIDRDIQFVAMLIEHYDVTQQVHAGVCILKLLQRLIALTSDKRSERNAI